MAAQTFILTSLCIGAYDKWASQAHRAITRRGIALMVKTRKAADNTIPVCDRVQCPSGIAPNKSGICLSSLKRIRCRVRRVQCPSGIAPFTRNRQPQNAVPDAMPPAL
jgi:hypothetical protein